MQLFLGSLYLIYTPKKIRKNHLYIKYNMILYIYHTIIKIDVENIEILLKKYHILL